MWLLQYVFNIHSLMSSVTLVTLSSNQYNVIKTHNITFVQKSIESTVSMLAYIDKDWEKYRHKLKLMNKRSMVAHWCSSLKTVWRFKSNRSIHDLVRLGSTIYKATIAILIQRCKEGRSTICNTEKQYAFLKILIYRILYSRRSILLLLYVYNFFEYWAGVECCT